MDPIRIRLRRLCEIATPGMLVPVADLRVLLDEGDDPLPEPAPGCHARGAHLAREALDRACRGPAGRV